MNAKPAENEMSFRPLMKAAAAWLCLLFSALLVHFFQSVDGETKAPLIPGIVAALIV